MTTGRAYRYSAIVMLSVLAACHGTLHTGKRAVGGADGDGFGGTAAAGDDGGRRGEGGAVGGNEGGAGGAGGDGESPSGGAGSTPAGGAAGTLAGGAAGTPAGGTPIVGGGGAFGGSAGIGRGGMATAGASGAAGGLRSGGQSGAPTTAGASGGGGLRFGGAGGTDTTVPTGGVVVGVTMASSAEPVDSRPEPPAWTSPFAQPLGTPGWQQSTSRVCDPNQGQDSILDVWADDRGVFMMMSAQCVSGVEPACPSGSASIKVNSGSGWQLLYQFGPGNSGYPRLWGGLPNGPLLVTGKFQEWYGAGWVDKDTFAFEKTFGMATAAVTASKGSPGEGLAYVADQRELFLRSAAGWSLVGSTLANMVSVWTDGTTVIAAGGQQTLLVGSRDGPLTRTSGVPAGDYSALWAFSPDDIWLGNTGAQLMHFDGNKWKLYPSGSRDMSGRGITNMWGASGMVYFTTPTEFGRWNGSSVEILLAVAADADAGKNQGWFGRFWGRSVNEVFLPWYDARYASYACGGTFILSYDGDTFHAF